MTPEIDCLPRSSDEPSSESESESKSESDETASLSRDDVFHVLQTARRREAIRFLLDRDGPVKMGDVAEYVAARENGIDVSELSSTQRQRVYIPLYQSHLPKLDEVGAIEYDKPRGIVRPTERLELFRPYLEAAAAVTGRGAEPDGSHDADGGRTYYLTATLVSASLLLTSAVGVLVIPGLVLGSIITGLFVLATTVTTLLGSPDRNDAADARAAK